MKILFKQGQVNDLNKLILFSLHKRGTVIRDDMSSIDLEDGETIILNVFVTTMGRVLINKRLSLKVSKKAPDVVIEEKEAGFFVKGKFEFDKQDLPPNLMVKGGEPVLIKRKLIEGGKP